MCCQVVYASGEAGIWVEGESLPQRGSVAVSTLENPFRMRISLSLIDASENESPIEFDVSMSYMTGLLAAWLTDGSGVRFGATSHPAMWSWCAEGGPAPSMADISQWLLWMLQKSGSKMSPRNHLWNRHKIDDPPSTLEDSINDSSESEDDDLLYPDRLPRYSELVEDEGVEFIELSTENSTPPPPYSRGWKRREKQSRSNRESKIDWDEDKYRLEKFLLFEAKGLMSIQQRHSRATAIAAERERATLRKQREQASEFHRRRKWKKWCKQATANVLEMQTMAAKLELEVKRENCKAMRAQQVHQPFPQRRGKWKKGPVLGPGPLPLEAMLTHIDPAIARATEMYEWDEDGRRQRRSQKQTISNLDHVFAKIRDLASRTQHTKCIDLDLSRPFQKFDHNGDGVITLQEFGLALLDLRVDLQEDELLNLFQYFDPNGSETIHFSEFVWYFFNRREKSKIIKPITS
jgi:hypothetical protein